VLATASDAPGRGGIVRLAQLEPDDYDEFGFLAPYAEFAGIPFLGRPVVRRESVPVDHGELSALVWGEHEPELVFLHGGGQNAHTWDTVALALGRPLVAVDLPGHGHSYRRHDRDYWPPANAVAVAQLVEQLAPRARGVVGMSLGGLTNIRLSAAHPALVRRTVVVDVTPSVHQLQLTPEQRGAPSLIGGPRTYESLQAMVDAAASAAGGRSAESLEIGVRHNARRRPDGTWTWRYDQLRTEDDPPLDFTELWDDVERLTQPTMLVRGSRSRHVPDDHATEFARRRPGARIEVVEGAGHSVQMLAA
jgi:pimeloyl-ACP methyl ester carboxylesterase